MTEKTMKVRWKGLSHQARPESILIQHHQKRDRTTHKAYDVLLFHLAHPRWEFVFQPKYAAYLNLIEPWWKTLKSLALKGKWFETWEEVEPAIVKASAYWNKHKHPFVWGKRRRHRLPKKFGIAYLPKATSI